MVCKYNLGKQINCYLLSVLVTSIGEHRICRQETSCPQDDVFPKMCYLRVNGEYTPLPVSNGWLGLHKLSRV